MQESSFTDNSITEILGYLTTILGGVIGMVFGFVLMILVIGLMVWPAYAKWQSDRQDRKTRRADRQRRVHQN